MRKYYYKLKTIWVKDAFNKDSYIITIPEYKKHLLNLQFGTANRETTASASSTGFVYRIDHLIDYYADGGFIANNPSADAVTTVLMRDSIVNEAWLRFNQKYWDAVMIESENDELTKDEVLEFLSDVWRAIYNSYDRYKAVLDSYTAKKGLLLDKIHNYSKSSFNDTPQNTGSFDDDSHRTNVTINEGETDVGTAMQRIAEIEKLYNDVYEQWVKEIGERFKFYK